MASSYSSLEGRFALVLGGTSGIGAATCLFLAQQGCSVCVVGRSLDRGAAVLKQCQEASPQLSHEFRSLDTSTIAAVKAFADEFRKTSFGGRNDGVLDILIHSAGGQSSGRRQETSEGIDERLATNVYSRFALTMELMEMLEKAAAVNQGRRPVVVSACNPGVGRLVAGQEDLGLQQHYSYFNYNAAVSLYNDLLFDEFARQHPKIAFVHVFPGVLATRNKDTGPWWVRLPLALAYPFLGNGASFASKMLDIVSGDERFASGGQVHLLDNKLRPVKPVADHSDANRSLLWNHALHTCTL